MATGSVMSTTAVPANVDRLLDGRSRTWLRSRAGWTAQYLSDRMRGRTPWSVADLVVLCEVLVADPAELLAPEPVEPAP